MGYWNAKKAIESNAQYKIIIGERGNGKSYSIKSYALERFLSHNEEFIYLRRQKEDIKPSQVESYFSDINIDKMTKGDYQSIVAWGGKIFLSKLENGVLKRSMCIGYYMALSAWEHFKSSQFPNVKRILFEEFTASHKLSSNITYLPKESEKLIQLVSTVFRERLGEVYLIGNTVDRTCPYFFEWQLDFIPKMNNGDNTTISIPISDTRVVAIYVEKTKNESNKHSMIFGKARNVIASGKWEVNEYKTTFPRGNIEKLYKLYYKNNFIFVIELYIDTDSGVLFNFVYPYTKKNVPTGERLIDVNYMMIDLQGLTTDSIKMYNKLEKVIYENIKSNNTIYSSNECGTDFNSLFTL